MSTVNVPYTVTYIIGQKDKHDSHAYFTDEINLKDFVNLLENNKITYTVYHHGQVIDPVKVGFTEKYHYWRHIFPKRIGS